MMLSVLPLGLYQANCYILENAGRCIAIDPGDEAGEILAFLQKKNLCLEAILLTHGHFDHVNAVETLVEETGCGVYLHRGDYEKAEPQWFPLAGKSFLNLHFLEHGQQLSLAGFDFSILHTPGHTQGSVCICTETVMFSGDTLFMSSIGRTDLMGGHMPTMQKTLAFLKALEKNYTVYPGHGPATTLDREKRVNPYLR